ncbi:MAG: hypothetical protein Ctma_1254 [Catillopecten margaritatus gill symbiont]|uniref:Uncharacterized protein n=1 Tax=Catillopecten margaritatus gill symbiont TaxID=3083288 RepID=A0AAU6PHM1_9GAMM
MTFVGLFSTTNVFSATLDTSNFSINSSVATVMDWYVQLLSKNPQGELLNQYPQNIQQIKVIKIKFIDTKQVNKHQFNVELLLTHKDLDKPVSKIINETIVLHLSSKIPKVEKIIKDKERVVATLNNQDRNQLYYQQRRFIYAWLAWMDGDQSRVPIAGKQSNYVVNIAGNQIQGNVFSALEKRSQYLHKGKHLLHSMEVKALGDNTFAFNIIVEYKGVNANNQKVIAKIRQNIRAKLNHNTWQIITIKEKHLLPDIAPWIGFVC